MSELEMSSADVHSLLSSSPNAKLPRAKFEPQLEAPKFEPNLQPPRPAMESEAATSRQAAAASRALRSRWTLAGRH